MNTFAGDPTNMATSFGQPWVSKSENTDSVELSGPITLNLKLDHASTFEAYQ